jgi:fatty-acyl-CoA synthase
MGQSMIEALDRAGPRPFVLKEKAWLRALERTAPIQQNPSRIFPAVIDEIAERAGDDIALVSASERVSYKSLSAKINVFARWGLQRDLAGGGVAGLLLENCPDYPAIWLGLTKIGAAVALLNTNLNGQALSHCIGVAGVRCLIVSSRYVPAVKAALGPAADAIEVWVHGGGEHYDFPSLSLDGLPSGRLGPGEAQAVTLADRALCIYTSGTTGLPKAANVSHQRIMAWSHWFAGLMDAGPDDRLYNCLPFYHAVGGVAATGAMLCAGGSVFVKEKFSARSFWQDVAGHDCTIFQYIGELCRYLLNASPSDAEKAHGLRLACGNGLGRDIWQPFKERFQIPHILEFYAATEANFSLYNVDEEPGSLGRIPSFLAHRFPIKLIKIDPETLLPLRGDDGFCIAAKPGEAGEGVFPISHHEKAGAASFEGYTSERDSEKKILRDVFAKGDVWYRSGDLFTRSAKGFYYFADRLGDTFRWKGENVSTQEVAQAISAYEGVEEAAVYGVAVPHAEGRAGMAAITASAAFDLGALKAHLDERLPSYAQPLFIRLVQELDLTPTFRPKKPALAAEGFDPLKVDDPLYFNDHHGGQFVRVTPELYGKIQSGEIRL